MTTAKPKAPVAKPFYASKTLWINILAGGAAVLGAFGVDFLDVETQGTIVAVIMGIVNVVLRFTTTAPVAIIPDSK